MKSIYRVSAFLHDLGMFFVVVFFLDGFGWFFMLCILTFK